MSLNFSTLAILPSYRCNVSCRHCGSSCGPYDNERMTNQEVFSLIDQSVDIGCKSIVVTGGEPTLLNNDLIDILSYSKRHRSIFNRRLVTNGHWAVNKVVAKELLTAWKSAGLTEINISCGEFHQEFIQLERVVLAYQVAVEMNFKTVLLGGEFIRENKGRYSPSVYTHKIGYRLQNPNQRSPFASSYNGMQCASVMNYGRGLDIDSADLIYHDQSKIASTCKDLFTSMTVHPDGKVTACCGVMTRNKSLLDVGDWRNQTLKEIAVEMKDDLFLNLIRYYGIKELRQFLQLKKPDLVFSGRYTSICDMCAEVLNNPACQELLYEFAGELHDATLVKKIIVDSLNSDNYRI